MNRAQVKPLHLALDVYKALVGLQVGGLVPTNIYVQDYRSGVIPPWQLAEREECQHQLAILTLIDVTTCHNRYDLFGWDSTIDCYVAIDVLTCPAKTLAGPFFTFFPGCEHARNMLCDIRQRARVISEQPVYRRRKEAHPSAKQAVLL